MSDSSDPHELDPGPDSDFEEMELEDGQDVTSSDEDGGGVSNSDGIDFESLTLIVYDALISEGEDLDIVHDTILRLMERGPRALKEPKAWARVAKHFEKLNQRRSTRRRTRLEREYIERRNEWQRRSSSDQRSERDEIAEKVVGWIEQLENPTTRLIFKLRYFEGWSFRKIAQHLEMPESTVRSRVTRELAKLQRKLNLSDYLALACAPAADQFRGISTLAQAHDHYAGLASGRRIFGTTWSRLLLGSGILIGAGMTYWIASGPVGSVKEPIEDPAAGSLEIPDSGNPSQEEAPAEEIAEEPDRVPVSEEGGKEPPREAEPAATMVLGFRYLTGDGRRTIPEARKWLLAWQNEAIQGKRRFALERHLKPIVLFTEEPLEVGDSRLHCVNLDMGRFGRYRYFAPEAGEPGAIPLLERLDSQGMVGGTYAGNFDGVVEWPRGTNGHANLMVGNRVMTSRYYVAADPGLEADSITFRVDVEELLGDFIRFEIDITDQNDDACDEDFRVMIHVRDEVTNVDFPAGTRRIELFPIRPGECRIEIKPQFRNRASSKYDVLRKWINFEFGQTTQSRHWKLRHRGRAAAGRLLDEHGQPFKGLTRDPRTGIPKDIHAALYAYDHGQLELPISSLKFVKFGVGEGGNFTLWGIDPSAGDFRVIIDTMGAYALTAVSVTDTPMRVELVPGLNTKILPRFETHTSYFALVEQDVRGRIDPDILWAGEIGWNASSIDLNLKPGDYRVRLFDSHGVEFADPTPWNVGDESVVLELDDV